MKKKNVRNRTQVELDVEMRPKMKTIQRISPQIVRHSDCDDKMRACVYAYVRDLFGCELTIQLSM